MGLALGLRLVQGLHCTRECYGDGMHGVALGALLLLLWGLLLGLGLRFSITESVCITIRGVHGVCRSLRRDSWLLVVGCELGVHRESFSYSLVAVAH